MFFLYNSSQFLPQTQLKGTRMFQTFRGSPALSEFRIQGLMQKIPTKSITGKIGLCGIFAFCGIKSTAC